MSVDTNVLFVSIDSLCRHFLSVYEPSVEIDVDTRNLDRFAERAAIFDSHYAGSLPCMPARREWLTGTQEFLWRPWGPIEPFDTTLALAARDAGVLTQLITDHYHYFQHGSHGYYEDFNGFEFIRGHEYDAWQTAPRTPDTRQLKQATKYREGDRESGLTDMRFMNRAQYARNVAAFDETEEQNFFAPQVFSRTAEWLRTNIGWEQWFCYVDCFDVHEPFHCPDPYASMYTDEDPRDPELTYWPFYGRTDRGQSHLTDRQLEFVRSQFAGKITMVDRWFGRVLDALDETDAWNETVVIVTADHGHYLGEYGWVGKPFGAPLYDVLAQTPLMIWDPTSSRTGERIEALTAAVDLYTTILDLLGVNSDDPRHSRSFAPVLSGDRTDHREWALYGYWGSTVNVTDGQYTYFQPCREDIDAYCHSTGMMSPHSWFTPREPQTEVESDAFLPYADTPVWRFPSDSYTRNEEPMVFDTATDPWQKENLAGENTEIEERMRGLLVTAMNELSAPEYQFERLDLDTHPNAPS